MKLIIAGSRTLEVSPYFIRDVIVNLTHVTDMRELYEIISGKAKGIDSCGEQFSETTQLPLKEFPADWDTHGKAAGHIRNKQMADYADALLLIWDGESRGSKNMKETMLKLGKPVYEVILRKHNV